MTQIYFAPFHAASGASGDSPCGSRTARFNTALARQDWPYDIGDDPSFYSSRTFGGPLTWGICRQDVRNSLRVGDIVVFFSFRKIEGSGESEYRLCAVATVEQKVSQLDLWSSDEELSRLRSYFNLLVRPLKAANGVWEHFEPALAGPGLHGDWLWRIADHRGLRKDDFNDIEHSDRLRVGQTIRGGAVQIADNYVLFAVAPAETYVLAKPPLVATHLPGLPHERWERDKFSQAVQRMTLGVAEEANGRRRWLRIRNSQRAHRHIRFKLPGAEAKDWKKDLLDLVAGL